MPDRTTMPNGGHDATMTAAEARAHLTDPRESDVVVRAFRSVIELHRESDELRRQLAVMAQRLEHADAIVRDTALVACAFDRDAASEAA